MGHSRARFEGEANCMRDLISTGIFLGRSQGPLVMTKGDN